MVWLTPRDWTDGETVTETIMDAHVRDQFNYLKGEQTGPAQTALDLGQAGLTMTVTQNIVATNDITATNQLKSSVAAGTAPITVNSDTEVTNLNSNKLQGADLPALRSEFDNNTLTVTGNVVGSATVTGTSIATLALNQAGVWLLNISAIIEQKVQTGNRAWRIQTTADANGTVNIEHTNFITFINSTNLEKFWGGTTLYVVNTANSTATFRFLAAGTTSGNEEAFIQVVATFLRDL